MTTWEKLNQYLKTLCIYSKFKIIHIKLKRETFVFNDSSAIDFPYISLFFCHFISIFNWRIIALENSVGFCHTSTRFPMYFLKCVLFLRFSRSVLDWFVPTAFGNFINSFSNCLVSAQYILWGHKESRTWLSDWTPQYVQDPPKKLRGGKRLQWFLLPRCYILKRNFVFLIPVWHECKYCRSESPQS